MGSPPRQNKGLWCLAMSPSDEAAVRRSVRFLQDRGIEVVFMVEPTRDANLNPSNAPAYLVWLNKLAASLDVELWDMNSIGWSDSLFADAYHFNAEGNKRFSSQIAQRLGWSDR